LQLIFIGVLAVLQSTLARYIGPHNYIHPNLLLVAVFCWSLLERFQKAVLGALFAGLALDILSAAPFGVFSASMVITAALASVWHERLSRQAFVLPVLLVIPYSIIYSASALIMLQLMGRDIGWGSNLGRLVFSVALMNIAAAVVILPLLQWLERAGEQKELQI